MTRNSRFVRILGSVVSWLLFALSFTLLAEATIAVGGVGGSCASGNTPYVIAHQCPNPAIWAAPAVFGGLIAVFLSFFLAQGFGTSLVVLAWPILFGVLGLVFLSSLEIVGYLLGAMFIAFALVPLILALRASAQRVFLGAVNSAGERFVEGPNARQIPYSVSFADSDNPVPPAAMNWLASILIWVVAGGVGVWLALKIDGVV